MERNATRFKNSGSFACVWLCEARWFARNREIKRLRVHSERRRRRRRRTEKIAKSVEGVEMARDHIPNIKFTFNIRYTYIKFVVWDGRTTQQNRKTNCMLWKSIAFENDISSNDSVVFFLLLPGLYILYYLHRNIVHKMFAFASSRVSIRDKNTNTISRSFQILKFLAAMNEMKSLHSQVQCDLDIWTSNKKGKLCVKRFALFRDSSE